MSVEIEQLFEDAADNRPVEDTSPEEAVDVTGDSGEAAEGAPPATGAPEKMVPETALVGVRKDFQSKVAALEQQLAQIRAAQQPSAEADEWTEDDYDDPQQLATKLESRFKKQLDTYRYASSEEVARNQYSDYDEVMQSYAELAQKSPNLAQEVDQATFPALHAYKRVKAYLEAPTDPDQAAQRINQLVEKRVAAEIQKVRSQLGARLPTGLASAPGATGAGTAHGQPWSGPTPLDKL